VLNAVRSVVATVVALVMTARTLETSAWRGYSVCIAVWAVSRWIFFGSLAIFQVITAVSMKTIVFWVATV
jgi:hypothetical protein